MNTRTIMHRWESYIQTTLSSLHTYQRQGLALFSFAAALAQDSCLSRLCAHAPSRTQPSSLKRRILRLLGNDRLDVEMACLQIACWLRRWNATTCRLVLLLDETPLCNYWRVLKISVAWRRRALPLCWQVYPLSQRPHSMEQTLYRLLDQARKIVHTYAPQARVELLADRGLCWPQLVQWCCNAQWDYLLRAQKEMLIRFSDAQGKQCCHHLRELAPHPGSYWGGRGEVFKKAGWIQSNVIAIWPRHARRKDKVCTEPWLLVTSLRPTALRANRYVQRMWQEQSFRDEKSHGFQWQHSKIGIRLNDPQRVNRFLLILALAQLWLMTLGDAALSSPWKQQLGYKCRATRRLWSVFRHGWQFLQWVVLNCSRVPKYFPCYVLLRPPT